VRGLDLCVDLVRFVVYFCTFCFHCQVSIISVFYFCCCIVSLKSSIGDLAPTFIRLDDV
jgi:hypothetical protein